MRKILGTLAAMVAIVGASAAPASAIAYTSSSTTGKSAWVLPLRAETPKIGPISADLAMRIAPSLSDILGPSNLHPGLTELTSTLFDASTNMYYHYQIADVELLGRFNPVVAPYIGARYLGIPTTEGTVNLAGAGSAVSYSQFSGLNYGLRAYTELPLGFSAFATLGGTSLLSGGWDTRQNGVNVTGSGRLSMGNTFLPSAAIGAGWNLFNIFALSVGYEVFNLPTGVRTQGGFLPSAQTTFSALNLGVRILFISF